MVTIQRFIMLSLFSLLSFVTVMSFFISDLSAGTIDVKGQWVYTDADGNKCPVKYAKIDIYDLELLDVIWRLAQTHTDGEGRFQVNGIENWDGLNQGGLDVFIRVHSDYGRDNDKCAVVVNTFGVPYHDDSPLRSNVNNGIVDFGEITINDSGAGKRAFDAYGACVKAYEFFKGLPSGWDTAKVTLRYPFGDWPCFTGLPFLIGQNLIYSILIPEPGVNPPWDTDGDPWNWKLSTFYHEFSHAVMYDMYGHHMPHTNIVLGPTERHTYTDERDEGFALIEGWAEAMALVIQGQPSVNSRWLEEYLIFADFLDRDDFDGAIVEGAVANALLDIMDDDLPWHDDDDGIKSGIGNLMYIAKNDKPERIADIKNRWLERDFDGKEDLKKIWHRTKIEQGPSHLLSIDIAGESAGKVIIDDMGYDLPWSGPIYENTSVVIKASPPDTSVCFDGWTGDVVDSEKQITLLMDNDKEITGTFNPFTMTVSAAGFGNVYIDNSLQSLPSETTANTNTVFQLKATPATDWMFDKWTGWPSIEGTPDETLQVINVKGCRNIIANFKPVPKTLTLEVEGMGRAKVNGEIHDLPGAIVLPIHTEITLEALRHPGWVFNSFQGDINTDKNPVAFTLSDNKTITIRFTALNPLPTVLKITPESISNDFMTFGPVSITGSGFIRNKNLPIVKLTAGGLPDIPATSVSYIDEGHLICHFNMLGACPGFWDVMVTNFDGRSGSLAQALEVRDAAQMVSMPDETLGDVKYRRQAIYLPEELGARPGYVTSIALNFGSIDKTYGNFTIRIKPTTKTQYTGTDGWESDGWTTVYQSDVTLENFGWRTFSLNAPYYYNGTDNLMIDISVVPKPWLNFFCQQFTAPGRSMDPVYSSGQSLGTALDWTWNNPPPNISKSSICSLNISIVLIPLIQSVTPSSGFIGKIVQNLNITGSNFQEGADVFLHKEGFPDILASNVVITDAEHMVCDLDLGGVPAGYYDVVVQNQGGISGSIHEFHVRNPMPEISSIHPDFGWNDGIVQINGIAGSGFMPDATVTLRRSGEIETVNASDVLIQPGFITCAFDLDGLEPGSFDVVVVNSDGQGTALIGGFIITEPGPAVVSIGQGNDSTYFPMGTGFQEQRTQTIYPAGEIGVKGQIRSLSLFVSRIPGQTMKNWMIRMRHSTEDAHSKAEWYPFGAQDIVCEEKSVLPESIGWIEFDFTTPFDYDGTSHLMVDFSFDNTSASTNGLVNFSLLDGGNHTIHGESNGDQGDPFAWAGTSGPEILTSTSVSNLRLSIWRPPDVSGIFPDSGQIGDSALEVEINGARFEDGASVVLRKAGQPDIVATSVTKDGSMKLNCLFNLTQAGTGLRDVVVTNPDGQSAILADGFMVGNPPPVVAGLMPDQGISGDHVDITNLWGTGFLSGALVRLTKPGQPDIAVKDVTVTSPGKIICTVDLTEAQAGTWNVVVTNPDGQWDVLSSGFTVKNKPPAVSGITPDYGMGTGVVGITHLDGEGFCQDAEVRLTRSGYPDVLANDITVADPTKITCAIDLNGVSAGLWDVQVINPDGQSGILTDGFRVRGLPLITGITPDYGIANSTANITITGSELYPGALVSLRQSGQPVIVASHVSVIDTTRIDCVFDLAGAAMGQWDLDVKMNNHMFSRSFMIAGAPMVVTIGDGTEPVSYPMDISHQDQRTQSLYLANEIGGSGLIIALGLDVVAPPGQPMNKWTIRMKTQGSQMIVPNVWVVSMAFGISADGQYQADEPVGNTGWRTFKFSRFFSYNGIDNITLDLSFNNDSVMSQNPGRCLATDTNAVRVIHGESNSVSGDPLNWIGLTPTPTQSDLVPNIQLTIAPITGHTLTTSVVPIGSGTICPGSGVFDPGTQVSLLVSPAPDWTFDHWEQDASGNNPSAQIILNADKTVIARFRRTIPKGDINGDGKVDLTDFIMAIRIQCRLLPSQPRVLNGDVDDDGVIGMPELHYILQYILEMRQ